jgi:hypothetical protein
MSLHAADDDDAGKNHRNVDKILTAHTALQPRREPSLKRFITVYTWASHKSLTSARLIHYILFHHVFNIRFNIILPPERSFKCSVTFRFYGKPLYSLSVSPTCAQFSTCLTVLEFIGTRTR